MTKKEGHNDVRNVKRTLVERFNFAESLLDRILQYLTTRTSLSWFVEDIHFYESRRCVVCEFASVDNDKLGCMSFIIQDCFPRMEIFVDTNNDDFVICLGFQYEHHDHGRNGHDFNFGLRGSIKEGTFEEFAR